jgi:hypothetical protein
VGHGNDRTARMLRQLLDCGSPLPLFLRYPSDVRTFHERCDAAAKAPEDWRTPKASPVRGGWEIPPGFGVRQSLCRFSFDTPGRCAHCANDVMPSAKAPEGWRTPKAPPLRGAGKFRQVLECGSPLPLSPRLPEDANADRLTPKKSIRVRRARMCVPFCPIKVFDGGGSIS